jgi:hypothetical protein
MTILERQHPEEYGQRTNVVISGDRPILFEHQVDVDAELERLQDRLGRGERRQAPPCPLERSSMPCPQ